MNIRKASCLLSAAFGMLTLIAAPPLLAAPLQDEKAANTEDIVYMADGRILHGRVIEETLNSIVFEYTHESLGITTKLTLQKANISKMERDVAVAAPEAEEATEAEDKAAEMEPAEADPSYLEKLQNQYGAQLADQDESLPGVYVIPMRGQMGTDVNIHFYEELADDIRRQDPDLIVFELDCDDSPDGLLMTIEERIFNGEIDPFDGGIFDLEQYQELVNLMRDDLRDYPQLMWVKDSVGISSVLALAWNEVYMHPDAQLTGLRQVHDLPAAAAPDDQVRAKWVAASIAEANAFLEYGGHPLEVGVAMIDPKAKLTATWRGREVEWSLNGEGVYVVDGSERQTTGFSAKTAEDFRLIAGTAETLDDVMLLHGYREYRLIPARAEQEFNDYVEDWRRTFESAITALEDFQKHMSWASGQDALRYLGRAKSDMQRVLAAIKRYDAVRVRLEMIGWDEFSVETTIMQLTERIRRLRQQNRNTGGNGGAPGRDGGAGRGG